jgi:hypothetical protein
MAETLRCQNLTCVKRVKDAGRSAFRAYDGRNTFPATAATITHLRATLGGEDYESLASDGAAMTTASAVAYALDQIERMREGLLSEQGKN